MVVNTYTLGAGGISEGITFEVSRGDTKRKLVRLGPYEKSMAILLGSHRRHQPPRYDNSRVLEGRALTTRDGCRMIVQRKGWNGALVLVDVSQLARFAGTFPAASFEGLSNIYPGVETISGAFAQLGSRNEPRQWQIVEIQHGETVYVADSSGRYVSLTCNNCRLYAAPATREGLAGYLQRYAISRCYSYRALEWVWHALDALGMTKLWTSDLQTRMDNLSLRH